MTDRHQPKPRSIETQFELHAPVEAVWKALTDGEELANWFPLEARVRPGVGGSVWVSWGQQGQFESPIAAWEPNRRLKLIYVNATPPEQAEQAKKQGFFIPFQVAVDYYLEARGDGVTVLRLVHSGFSNDPSWDSQYDGTVRGWQFELRGLKHYLERHRGTKRVVVHARHDIGELPLAEAWARLMSAEGLLAEGRLDGLKPGERYHLRTVGGDEFRGVIQILNPPQDLCATVENLNDALLRMRIDESCFTSRQREANLWLSTFGLEAAQTDALRQRHGAMLGRLFETAAAPR